MALKGMFFDVLKDGVDKPDVLVGQKEKDDGLSNQSDHNFFGFG